MGERLEAALALEMARTGQSREEVLAAGQAKVPLGRYATNEDIAQVALFLASARAAYLTGAIIPMDGGACQVV
jgi:NAD(P)-dependent dehydrogenase (short-subunit alcohol dehydrogenase family)